MPPVYSLGLHWLPQDLRISKHTYELLEQACQGPIRGSALPEEDVVELEKTGLVNVVQEESGAIVISPCELLSSILKEFRDRYDDLANKSK